MSPQKLNTVELALGAYEAGKKSEAFRSMKGLAEAGDESAYHVLAYFFDVGAGTRRSKASALFWYLNSYRAGNSSSASNIAAIHRDRGNAKLEFEWYGRAAALGDGDADLEVAIRYLAGKGVRRSLRMAIRHLKATRRSENVSEGARDAARQLLWGTVRKRRGV